MYRESLVYVLMVVFACQLGAAPIPERTKEDARKKQIGQWATDLRSYQKHVRLRAMLNLVAEPNSFAVLQEFAPPVQATKAEIEGWLANLSDADDAVRNKAIEKLSDFPGVLQLTHLEQFKLCKTERSRRGLVQSWRPSLVAEIENFDDIEVRTHERGSQLNYKVTRNQGRNIVSIGIGLSEVEDHYCAGWTQSSFIAVLAHLSGSKSAEALLRNLAQGHAKAFPTKVAAYLLKQKSPLKAKVQSFDVEWKKLAGPFGKWVYKPRTEESFVEDAIASFMVVQTWIEKDKPVAALKKVMKPLKADAEQLRTWLKDLGNEDAKVWEAARHNLTYFDPRLGLGTQETVSLLTDGMAKQRFCDVVLSRPMEYEQNLAKCELTIEKGHLHLDRPSGGLQAPYESLKELCKPSWDAACIGILVLEQIQTDEAISIIKDMTTGHPDAITTRVATAALERIQNNKKAK